jgi:hypothetical protein
MSKIQDLPVELLLDNLLPKLETKALLNLSCANKYLLDLGNEDLVWKRKLLDDYNFDGSKSARQSGWKTIYKGLAYALSAHIGETYTTPDTPSCICGGESDWRLFQAHLLMTVKANPITGDWVWTRWNRSLRVSQLQRALL